MGLERKIDFWGLEDDENLTHTEMDDAIESALDSIDDIKDLPETIEVCGYARAVPNPKKEVENVISRLLEGLDEEYGNPDGGYTDPTDSMIKASEAFVSAVIEKYKVWACDLIKRETINVQEWIKENRPDWLEEVE